MLGSESIEIMADFFDEESAAGFVRWAGKIAIGKTPFRNPARLTLR
jgi:hypothetical protein